MLYFLPEIILLTFELLTFLHRRLSFLVTFYAPRAAGGKALSKFLSFAPTGPLKTLVRKPKKKKRIEKNCQGLFWTYVGCDYRTQSSALNFEKSIFIRNG